MKYEFPSCKAALAANLAGELPLPDEVIEQLKTNVAQGMNRPLCPCCGEPTNLILEVEDEPKEDAS